MLRRMLGFIGISLMMCIGQQSTLNLLAIDKKIVEVGLPLQVSAQPVDENLLIRGVWVQGGRYLVYALRESPPPQATPANLRLSIDSDPSGEGIRLFVYDTASNRSTRVVQEPILDYLCTEQGIFLVSQRRMSESDGVILTLSFYEPNSGRFRPLYQKEDATTGVGSYIDSRADSRFLLVSLETLKVVMDKRTLQMVTELPKDYVPFGFLDANTLWGVFRNTEPRQYGAFDIPTRQIRLMSREEITQHTRHLRVPQALQPTRNLKAVKKDMALYLCSLTTKNPAYEEAFLTHDAQNLPYLDGGESEGDASPEVPLAFIAPDESGLAYITLFGQLFYVPLKKRAPATVEEALACGVEPDRQMVIETYTRNAKEVALALLAYAADYDETFPHEKVEEVLRPYVPSDAVFQDFRTGQSIFTFTLYGHNLAQIEDLAKVSMGFFDWGDPEWIVVMYVDGHVEATRRNQ